MKEKKSASIMVRLTESEKKEIEMCARNLGISVSTLVRFSLKKCLEKLEGWRDDE